MKPARLPPSVALAAFSEKLLEGRRVVVFGSASSALPETLLARGARLVHLCDAESSRVAAAAARNTSPHISFGVLDQQPMAVREGSFDVGLVEDLSAYKDSTQVLRQLRRILTPRAVAFVAAPNPDGTTPLLGELSEPGNTVDYYALYDCVHEQFPVVRMLGQMPFVGYTVAELAPAGEPSPTIDAGFLPSGTEEPEWFVAVGATSDIELDPFVIVQIPREELAHEQSQLTLREQLRTARSAERTVVERLARVEAECAKLRSAAQVQPVADPESLRRLRVAEQELDRKEQWIHQLEARAAAADARADQVEQDLDELSEKRAQQEGQNAQSSGETAKELSSLRERLLSFEEQAAKATERATLLEKELGSLKLGAATLETELTTAKSGTHGLEEQLATTKSGARDLEAQLTEAKSGTRELQTQLATAKSCARDLEAQLAAAKSGANKLETELATAKSGARELEAQLIQARADASRQTEIDPQPLRDVERLEALLVDRSTQLRELTYKLRVTEQLGERLVRELESALAKADAQALSVQTRAEASKVVTAPEGSFATETWLGDVPVGQPPSTVQTTDITSKWSASPPPKLELAPTSTPTDEQPDLPRKLDHLAALCAEQLGNLAAAEWRIQELVQRIEDQNALRTRCQELTERLSSSAQELQKFEVLVAQLRSPPPAN
jgi:hypothetical protein